MTPEAAARAASGRRGRPGRARLAGSDAGSDDPAGGTGPLAPPDLAARLGWTPPSGPPEQAGRMAVSELVMRTFRLNGQFMATGDALSQPAGLTSARWQVLGAVLQYPLTVSGIAREMGLTRQSVQRIANDLVGSGLAEFLENPAHRRALLMRPTPAGFQAVGQISQGQHAWAQRIVDRVGEQRLRDCVDTLNEVIRAVDELPPDPPD